MDAIDVLRTLDRQRMKAKISKRAVCSHVGINSSYYSDCLAGRKHGLTLETACKISQLLGFELVLSLPSEKEATLKYRDLTNDDL